MNLLSRSHLVAVAATAIMAVGVGAALANTQGHHPPFDGGKHAFHGPCSPAQVQRNKATVVAYYTTAFNDKNPELAVAKYGGPIYIQHNRRPPTASTPSSPSSTPSRRSSRSCTSTSSA